MSMWYYNKYNITNKYLLMLNVYYISFKYIVGQLILPYSYYNLDLYILNILNN